MRAPLLACLCALWSVAAPALEPASDRIVVLISVDGLMHSYLDDPKAEMPTIRRLAAEGVRADRMRCSLPTVTWVNHTTLVTGVSPARHGVLGNSYFDRAKGVSVPLLPDPLFNKEEIVRSPTVYDAAKEHGLKTSGIIWPASRSAKNLDWTVPDVAPQELFDKHSTPGLLDEFKAAGIAADRQGEYCKKGDGQARDRMYVQMLNHVIRTKRPNLALLHLVEVDHVEHAHGPNSPEAYEIVKFADDRVREVWDELQRSFPGRATLIVTADHGFQPVRRTISPNVLLRSEGLLQVEGGKITSARVRAHSQGGSTFIYVLDESRRAELVTRVARSLRTVEGVDVVITPDQYAAHGLALPSADPRMPDLVVGAKSGFSFGDGAAGTEVVSGLSKETKGSHGHDPTQPELHAAFVAWGAGIAKGVRTATIDNRDVAPTVGALLGFGLPGAEGRVLDELLVK